MSEEMKKKYYVYYTQIGNTTHYFIIEKELNGHQLQQLERRYKKLIAVGLVVLYKIYQSYGRGREYHWLGGE